jgi:hypothetical protein
VSQFRGLAGTGKQKAVTGQLAGVRRLSDLVNGHGLDTDKTKLILQAMKGETKPVQPEALGIIGEAHFKAELGAENVKYHCYRHKGEVPFVVEAAFAYNEGLKGPEYTLGLNFAPAFGDPFANTRLVGKYRKKDDKFGYGVKGLASEFKLHHDDKAHLIVHVTHPALIFQDRGKVHVAASADLRDAVGKAVSEVLKHHCATKKREDRELEAQYAKRPEVSLRDAVFAVMREAACRASGDGALPYSVRQLYYKVRPLIQQYTSRELKYAYFTPALVTEYEDEYGSLAGLIYDARGHLYEPHNGTELSLGTTEVDEYQIPDWEYDKILYIEKEGFQDIFEAADLGRRYDMAIMTAKGFACRAAKQLLNRALGRQITILAAHDADIAGYEIARTLAEETRTSRGIHIRVIDIGLNVKEALAMGLEKEAVYVKRKMSSALRRRLTEEEYNFLRQYRIELNAMTSDQLVGWIEGKLAENGLASKVVPPDDVLAREIEARLEEGISERADRAVTSAIERILGLDLASLGQELAESLKRPETGGHRDDLAVYMADCPADHWRQWAEGRAQTLEIEATTDLPTLAEARIRELLDGK